MRSAAPSGNPAETGAGRSLRSAATRISREVSSVTQSGASGLGPSGTGWRLEGAAVVEQLRARCDAEALSCDRIGPEVKGPDHSVAASDTVPGTSVTLGPDAIPARNRPLSAARLALAGTDRGTLGSPHRIRRFRRCTGGLNATQPENSGNQLSVTYVDWAARARERRSLATPPPYSSLIH